VDPTAHRQYRQAPIAEAICEFQFAPGDESVAFPSAKLHEEIKQTYDGIPRAVLTLVGGFQGGVVAGGDLTSTERVQLPNEDQSRLVTVGQNLLSINILPPYAGWIDFQSRVHDVLPRFMRIAKPRGVTRIGLRYINRLLIPGDNISPAEFLNMPIRSPSGFPTSVESFLSRLEFTYGVAGERLVLTVSTLPQPAPGRTALLLDLDAISNSISAPISADAALAKLSELKKRQHEAFEGIITDRSREVFDATA